MSNRKWENGENGTYIGTDGFSYRAHKIYHFSEVPGNRVALYVLNRPSEIVVFSEPT